MKFAPVCKKMGLGYGYRAQYKNTIPDPLQAFYHALLHTTNALCHENQLL